MARIMIAGFRCERCDHEWVPREKDEEPRVCPKCKSPYWDRPRQTGAVKPAKATRKSKPT